MSTTAADRVLDPAQPRSGTALVRTCRAEWSRLWTVRSTWWFSLATAVTVLGIGTVLGIDVAGDPPSMQPEGSAWRGGSITSTFGLYGLLALAVVAVTADHATGGIIPTLQATPRRQLLLVARTAVVVAYATLLGLVVVAGSAVTVYAFAPEMGLPIDIGVEFLGAVAFVYATGTLVAVGVSLLVRNTAGSLVAVLAAMLLLPLMLSTLPFDWATFLARALPGTSAMRLLAGEAPVELTPDRAYLTLLVWTMLAMAAGTARLLRSDADR